jgi:putative membrane protein (TIGR04086 family)
MEYDRERSTVPVGSILYGTLVTLVVFLILSIIFTVLTELGWTAGAKPYSDKLYLFIEYLAVIIGAIMAGRESSTKGWFAGLGVGAAGSVVFVVLNAFTGQPVVWGIFLVKTMLINIFIGIFSGVIGINLASSKK